MGRELPRRVRALLLDRGKASRVENIDREAMRLLASHSEVISRKNLMFIRAGLSLAPFVPLPYAAPIAEIVAALRGCEEGWSNMLASVRHFLACDPASEREAAMRVASQDLEMLAAQDNRLETALAAFTAATSATVGSA